MKTNEQLIKALMKDLSTMEVAFLRERLLVVSAYTRKSIAETPDRFMGFASEYLSVCDKIDKHLTTAPPVDK